MNDEMPKGYSWWESALDTLAYATVIAILIGLLVVFGEPL